MFFALSMGLNAKTINNPVYRVRNNGIFNITKIETGKENTKLYFEISYEPGLWIKLEDSTYIQDEKTGKKYYVINAEGIEYHKKITFPESGKIDAILTYPALPKKVKTINWSEKKSRNSTSKIYGINIKNKKKSGPEKVKLPFPSQKGTVADDFNDFFHADTAYIQGCISGYDSVLNLDNGIIYLSNEITNYDMPVVLKIEPNGVFHAKLPLIYPVQESFRIRLNKYFSYKIDFYIEPGNVLNIGLDWEDLIGGEKFPRKKYKLSKLTFSGPTAEICRHINNTEKYRNPDYKYYRKCEEDSTVEDYRRDIGKKHDENFAGLEKYFSKNNCSAKARKLILNDLKLNNYYFLLGYGDKKIREARKDSTLCNIDNSYYDFLDNLEDKTFLASEGFGSFINKLEFSDPVRRNINSWRRYSVKINSKSYISFASNHGLNIPEEYIKAAQAYTLHLGDSIIMTQKEVQDLVMSLNKIAMLDKSVFEEYINENKYVANIKNVDFLNPGAKISVIVFSPSYLSFVAENGIILTTEEKELQSEYSEIVGDTVVMTNAEFDKLNDNINDIVDKDKSLLEKYRKEYGHALFNIESVNEVLDNLLRPDSIKAENIVKLTGKKQSMVKDIILARSICYHFGELKNYKPGYLSSYKKAAYSMIDNKDIKRETDRYYNNILKVHYPYELPHTEAARVFKKIIKEHKGKYLLVDFWGTFCGPCRSKIEHTAGLRKKLKDDKDFEFIYITGADISPEGKYNKYVEKNLKGEASYRVSESDYLYFRELFHFSGIPHYVLVDRFERILNDDFPSELINEAGIRKVIKDND